MPTKLALYSASFVIPLAVILIIGLFALPSPNTTVQYSKTSEIGPSDKYIMFSEVKPQLGQVSMGVIEMNENSTPTPTQAPYFASSEHLDSLFSRYSNQFAVDKEKLQHVAACESSFNSQATYGDYGGMFQFATQTWETVRFQMGLSTDPALRFSSDEAIKTASYYLSKYGDSAWPGCK